MDFRIVLLIFTAFVLANAKYKSYENYKLYKIVPVTEEEVQIVTDLQKNLAYSFWTDVVKKMGDVRIMVAPEQQKEFEDYLNTVNIKNTVITEDVQALINAQRRRPTDRITTDYAWDHYQTLEEIHDWLNEVAETYPDIVTLEEIGTSEEDKAILGVKIDYKKQDNPTIAMIEGGIHAREWISPATVTWIIKEFLTSNDPEVRFLAENIVWYIFPVTNPDGYVYTFTDDRMWRKNRNPDNNGTCAPWNIDDDMSNGIDLNRNFGFLWMTTGASSNPCSEVYAGPVANSEHETRAIIQHVIAMQNEGNLVYYFAFHSFSQMVLVPFSHVGGADVLEAPNYGDMFEIAIKGMDKLREKHGTIYTVGTSADILYEVSGSSFDWAKGVAEIPIVYLFELRDYGDYGFLLPPHLIVPNNEEIMDGLIEMDKVARAIGYWSDANKLTISTILISMALMIVMFVVPTSEAQVQILVDLQKSGYDFWSDGFSVGKDVRIIVKPDQVEEFLHYSKSVGFDAVLRISNIEDLIKAQRRPARNVQRNSLGSFDWDNYHTLEEIHDWLDELERMYPNVVTNVTIGTSVEGRSIKGIIINFNPNSRGESPLIGMIEGGIHSREWISPATVTWIIREFLTSNDRDVRFLAEAFIWHIFPVVNPDGYEYTFTNDRMWRKNRNRDNFIACNNTDDDLSNGIDLNRNFDFLWMTVGASLNPCTQTYAGPSPGSERETQAISAHVNFLKGQGNFIYYFAFHSYSQMVLVPFSHVDGFDVLQADNYADMFEIAMRGADKLKSTHGTEYEVGTSLEILYAVSGSSFDWVKGVAEVPIVYLFELRDTEAFGFLLPSEEIVPNNEEIMECLLEMDRTTRALRYYSGAHTALGSIVSLTVSIGLLFLFK